MFELFEKLLFEKDYFGAGAILSKLGGMLRPATDPLPEGFYNAQVRIIPLEDCLHIFMVFDSEGDFKALPGDLTECVHQGGTKLYTKAVQLSELWNLQYSHGIILHFMHCKEIELIEGGLSECVH